MTTPLLPPARHLSDFAIESFFKSCFDLINARADAEIFRVVQRLMMAQGEGDLAVYLRQLKKCSADERAMIRDMFSTGQVAAKLWLAEALRNCLPADRYDAVILGGWAGLLSQILLWRQPEHGGQWARLTSVDLDAEACRLALHLNEPAACERRFHAVAMDLQGVPFDDFLRPTVVINTVVEHVADNAAWIQRLPAGQIVALQASSHAGHDGHVHAFASLEELEGLADWSTVLFRGQLETWQQTRWMVIAAR